MGTLREQMVTELQLRGITAKTQKAYLKDVRDFALYFKKSPEQMGEKEIKEYLLYILNEKKASEGTFKNCRNALKFLYRTTLKRDWVVENIPCPKSKRKLPVVLDLSEVEAFSHQEPEAQGDPDDHVFFGAEDQRNGSPEGH